MAPISLDLYYTIFTAREIDQLESHFTSRGEAFFHVSGGGHEAMAALNPHLIPEDYLHLHYRDKALMLARGIPPEMFFLSLFCKDASHSRGRQMSAHLCSRELNILSLVGPVGNNALQAVGVAAQIKDQTEKPLVVCSLGDGTTQQGEVLEAIAEAVRRRLPVLFVIEDNRYAISSLTEKSTFYDLPHTQPDFFYGIPIRRFDGRNVLTCFDEFGSVITCMRESRLPAIIHLSVERLTSHTHADDQTVYRSAEEITKIQETADPVANLRDYLIKSRAIEITALEKIEREIRETLMNSVKSGKKGSDPLPIYDAKKPLPAKLTDPDSEYTGNESQPRLTMLCAIREVLKNRLISDRRVTLYGEDIEDPKGDVFGVTKGLSTAFPGRVVNSPLSESTIVGTSIGRALAGGRPVAFLQFADFLPLALNQIINELGSMYWRTDGAWQCPVIIMICCGGYRPGLGPFHAQSLESLAVHTPGIDVMMPQTAGDAAGLFNAAFESERPTLFFYPKSALNLHDTFHTTSPDVNKQWVPIGQARIERFGDDITFVSYGNTVEHCRKTADALERVAVHSDVIDLRCLSPWDKTSVIQSAQKTKRVIVVHEDNQSCGMSAEIIATINEFCSVPVQCRRINRADTYVPCNFANQLHVLPSYHRVLNEAADLLDFNVHWEPPPKPDDFVFHVEAMGTAPSDESVFLVEWYVSVGATITEGQPLACIEATKASFDLESPVAGIVKSILVDEEREVTVGSPIAIIQLADSETRIQKPISKEQPGKPILTPKDKNISISLDSKSSKSEQIQSSNDSIIARLTSTYSIDLDQWKNDSFGEQITVKKIVELLESGLGISRMEEQYFDESFELWKSLQAFTFRSDSNKPESLNDYKKELKSLAFNVQSPFGGWVALLKDEKYVKYRNGKNYNLIGWLLVLPMTNNPITRKQMCEASLYVIDPQAHWTPSVILLRTVLKKLENSEVQFVYGHTSPNNKESMALLKEVGFVNYGKIPKGLHTGVLQNGFRIWGYSMPCKK